MSFNIRVEMSDNSSVWVLCGQLYFFYFISSNSCFPKCFAVDARFYVLSSMPYSIAIIDINWSRFLIKPNIRIRWHKGFGNAGDMKGFFCWVYLLRMSLQESFIDMNWICMCTYCIESRVYVPLVIFAGAIPCFCQTFTEYNSRYSLLVMGSHSS